MFERINQLIGQGKTPQAIKEALEYAQVRKAADFEQELVLLSGRCRRNEHDNSMGVLATDAYRVELARITAALQDIAADMAKEFPEAKTPPAAPHAGGQSRADGFPDPLPALTGAQVGMLMEALAAAFPSIDELKRFVRLAMDANLHAITGNGNLLDAAFDIITHYESEGTLRNMLVKLYQAKPNNPKVQALLGQWG